MRIILGSIRLPAIAALLAAFSSASPAAATGYWNVPSTLCQCMGCGWGAGYHAHFILGPITCSELCDHKEVRLPYAPVPCYSCGDCAQCGAYDCQPQSHLQGTVTSPPLPIVPISEPAIAPAPAGAIFDAPVEQ